MRLKSHVRPNRGAERHGRPRSRLATLVTVGTVTLGFAGLGIAMSAGPALADPTIQEVAAGSDTIQDVMNAYSVDLNSNLLGSYNAVDPNPPGAAAGPLSYVKGPNASQPKQTCLPWTRPNGSGQGQIALRESINPGTTAAPPLPTPPPQNCVDIARSSSSPAQSNNQSTNGALIFIPFGEDAVTGAVGPAVGGVVNGTSGPVTTVPTAITQASLFTFIPGTTPSGDLVTLYKNCTNVTEGGITYHPNGDAPAGSTTDINIDLYLPQPGSGTRNFWATTLNFSNTTPPACVHDHIIAGTSNGTAVEEHNGIAVGTDPNGYMPFSIAQWISQSNHTAGNPVNIDRRYGAVLQNVAGVFPCSNGTNCSAAGSTLNSAFPINREVYNVVEGCKVTSTSFNPLVAGQQPCPAGSIDPNLQSMLLNTGSLCRDRLTILQYGFALLVNNPNEPDTCGSIATSLWAYVPPV